jgi:hypothetical protein
MIHNALTAKLQTQYSDNTWIKCSYSHHVASPPSNIGFYRKWHLTCGDNCPWSGRFLKKGKICTVRTNGLSFMFGTHPHPPTPTHTHTHKDLHIMTGKQLQHEVEMQRSSGRWTETSFFMVMLRSPILNR